MFGDIKALLGDKVIGEIFGRMTVLMYSPVLFILIIMPRAGQEYQYSIGRYILLIIIIIVVFLLAGYGSMKEFREISGWTYPKILTYSFIVFIVSVALFLLGVLFLFQLLQYFFSLTKTNPKIPLQVLQWFDNLKTIYEFIKWFRH